MKGEIGGSRQAPLHAGRNDDLAERARAWVEKSCAEQGVPVKLSDPLALAKIADILGEARDAREKSTRSGKRAA
jgi:hypothetical protein